ncbi:hypothetical protein GF386_06170 [Candidatus Pacearchaeota archaeon]|nr:hypothetical protein [Candidatus Pacearchaeota archaeon]MBD3283675.1 hypothetical protein [Candidatus Pacearchaeota archaeon]
MILQLIIFTISCGILITSGIFLVRSLSKIARLLGISEFSASFIIMAFATSIPELFVGVTSAIAGKAALSLGNVIGANIIDLTLITGMIILTTKEINFKTQRIGHETDFMLTTILFLIILYVIGDSISRIDGIILLGLFSIHTYKTMKKRKKYPKKMKKLRGKSKGFIWLGIFLLALLGLFFSSHFVVESASELAIQLDFPQMMIGLFLLSIATTLPELVFGLSASKLKHKEMAIGDQIGTVVANTTLVVGLVAIIQPITVEPLSFLTSALFMFIAAFIFVTFLKTGGKLERIEGMSLILIYVLFIIIEFFLR